MAPTIAAAAGDPFEPSPGMRALLSSIAETQRRLEPVMRTQRQITAVLEQQRRIAAVSSSLSALRSLQPALSVTDSSAFGGISERLPQAGRPAGAITALLQQTNQLRTGLDLIRQMPIEQRFSDQTFRQAEIFLDRFTQTPPEEVPEFAAEDLPREVEQELESLVESIAPTVRGMGPERARRIVVGYVSTVVFLLVIQLSLTHPEIAEVLTGTGGLNALTSAGAAGWATGRVWDRLQGTGPANDDPSSAE
ncbi:hypothetical protein ACPB9J_31550 [Streptomyces lavendulocolor]|uniref:hypothetical protein n=1 Tax=Streptomyces lavendulocolor TaxID=67316 RepID=UPI003C2D07D1